MLQFQRHRFPILLLNQNLHRLGSMRFLKRIRQCRMRVRVLLIRVHLFVEIFSPLVSKPVRALGFLGVILRKLLRFQ